MSRVKYLLPFFAVFFLISAASGVRIGAFEKGIGPLEGDNTAEKLYSEDELGGIDSDTWIGLSTTATVNGGEDPSSAVIDMYRAVSDYAAKHCEPDPVSNDNECDGHNGEYNTIIFLDPRISVIDGVETGRSVLESQGTGSSSTTIEFEQSYSEKPHLFLSINDFSGIKEKGDFGNGHSLRVNSWLTSNGKYVGAEVKHCQQGESADGCAEYPEEFSNEVRYVLFDSSRTFSGDERFSGSSSFSVGRNDAGANGAWDTVSFSGGTYTPSIALGIGHGSGSDTGPATYPEINELSKNGFDFRVCKGYDTASSDSDACGSHPSEPVSYLALKSSDPNPDYGSGDNFGFTNITYDLPPIIESVKYREKDILESSEDDPVTFNEYLVELNISYREYERDIPTFKSFEGIKELSGGSWTDVSGDYSISFPGEPEDYGGTAGKGWRIVRIDLRGGTGSDVVSETGEVYRWAFRYGDFTGDSNLEDVRRQLDNLASWESELEYDSIGSDGLFFDFSVPPSVSCGDEGCHQCENPGCEPYGPGDVVEFSATADDDNQVDSIKFCPTKNCAEEFCSADFTPSTSVTASCTAEIDETWDSFQEYYVVVEDGAGNSAGILGGRINVMKKVFSTERNPRINVSFSTDDFVNLFVSNQGSSSREYRIEARPSMDEGRVDVSFQNGFKTEDNEHHLDVSPRSTESVRATFSAMVCSDVCSGNVDIVLTDLRSGNTYTETVPVTIRSYADNPSEPGGVLSGSAPGITMFQILVLVFSVFTFSLFYRF